MGRCVQKPVVWRVPCGLAVEQESQAVYLGVFYCQGYAVVTRIHPLSVNFRVSPESLYRGSNVSEEWVAARSVYKQAVFSTVLHILPVDPIST